MPPEGKPLVLLVNPASGGGRSKALLPRVADELDKRRIVFRVEKTRSAEHAVDEALRAADLDELPVVMSGDGLIGTVGGALAGGEVPLGIIPAGRGNDLARVLGIPTEPEEAVAVLAEAEPRTIDVGEVNGRRFLGIASAGFDSDCQDIANRTKFVRGRWVYAYSALRALAAWKPARFTLRIGEENLRFTGWSVAAANSGMFGGGMRLAPDASLEDGEFDIVMVGDSGKLRYISNLPKVFKGTHVESEEVRIVRARSLELSASRPFAVYADGEHLTDLPASLRVLPRALSVMAPPSPA
jgi:YegS/Rv2252/BmrU family lipid kinase